MESGPIAAAIMPMSHATKAWAADVNSRGGLDGHPVDLVFGDDGGDAARALALVKRMVEQDNVIAFLNVNMPLTLHAVTPYLEERKVPALAPCACTFDEDTSPMLFPVLSSPAGTAYSAVLPLLSMSDKRKVAVVYCQEAGICKRYADNVQQDQGKFGIQVVYKAQATLTQPDYTAEMLAARNAGADAVVLFMENTATRRIIRSAHRQGYSPVFSGGFSIHDDRLLAVDTEGDLDGVLIGTATAEYSTSPKMADYRAAVKKYVPNGIYSAQGASTWGAGKLIEAFAARLPAGHVTSNDFLEGLYSLQGETAGGMLPPMAYRRDQGHRDTDLCVVPVRVEKRHFVAPKGDEFVCHPDWKPVKP